MFVQSSTSHPQTRLGDILRAGTNRITYKAVIEQKQLELPGNLLMDVPPHVTMEELAVKAKDRGYGKSLVASIPWQTHPNQIYFGIIVF